MPKMTLKTLRTLKNWRQSDAAEAVNVSVDTWGHWERGVTEPSVSKAYQIASVFEVSVDDIIFLPEVAVKPQKKIERSKNDTIEAKY